MRSSGRRRGAFRSRFARDIPVVLTAAILVAAAWNAALIIPPLVPKGIVGGDFRIYHDAASRWLQTGAFYTPHQLMGSYSVSPGDVLYPPTILYLLVPFLVLPALLWWVVPLSIIAAVIVRLRPARWAWPLMALAVWWPRDQGLVVLGNPGMWAAAAISASLVFGWPSALVLLKPSLAPFALVGAGTRGWWRVIAAVFLGSIGLVGLWVEYANVLSNSDVGIGYSLLELPFMLIPLVAWAGRADRESARIGLTAVHWIRHSRSLVRQTSIPSRVGIQVNAERPGT